MRLIAITAAAVAAVTSPSAHSSTIEVVGVMDTPFALYQPFPGQGAAATAGLTASTRSPTRFAFDFSTIAEDTTLRVIFRAPAGKQIEIAIPDEYDRVGESRISFSTDSPAFGGPGFESLPPTYFFEDIQGGPLELINVRGLFSGQFPNGAAVVTDLALEPGDTVSFSSVTAEVVVPATFAGLYDASFSMIIDAQISAVDPINTPPDPGQFIRLTNIPEPTSLALLGLGGLVVAWRRR